MLRSKRSTGIVRTIRDRESSLRSAFPRWSKGYCTCSNSKTNGFDRPRHLNLFLNTKRRIAITVNKKIYFRFRLEQLACLAAPEH